ncbi:MAG: alpha/beta fold hydrolase [Proteobacteria bacterium]|nr:alpha/beta fold hydrolase [Pseudomonadota bacterium]MDA1311359.1 alpha/beta fold hydrolase [Pseudomonadota bacterium]
MAIEKIRVGDIEIAHRWDGNPDGPVVMMAHAMGTSHRIWDLQVAALADRYRLLRYDWRGHGDTSAPEDPYTLAQFLDDAVGTMDVLGLDRVHWVGISTGGMIGQGLGIHFGDRIRSLTLCNTTSQSNPWYRDWVAERQKVVKEGGMHPVWDMTKRLWFTDAYVDAENADYHDVREAFVRTPVPGYLGGTSAVADLAYRDLLSRITAPTNIIAAGADPVAPIERSKEIHDGIAGSKLTVIEGQRHFSNIEVPAAFNAILRAGLDEMSL